MSIARKVLKDRRRGLRQNATEAETVLWKELRQLIKYDFKFRRQHNIGWYIADFYCSSAKLVIEVDGPIHDSEERKSYDAERTEYLKACGCKILRFKNDEVINTTNEVVKIIFNALTTES